MPELPEVETIARKLRNVLLKRRFETMTVLWAKTIANINPEDFIQTMQGATVNDIRRRGKYLIFDLDNNKDLVIHLRMSGKFSMHPAGAGFEDNKHTRVRMLLDNELVLNYIDQRKFGRFYLVDDANTITSKLGPEPLSSQFSVEWLKQGLSQRTAQLKTLLLNQSFIAGLGNIYASEALWDARLHPCRISSTISRKEATALHRAIRNALKKGLKNMGTTLGTGHANFYSVGRRSGRNSDQLNVFRRTGQPCPRCKKTIERIIVGQRSTHICTTCQKLED
ncbi:MAG: bifunctional DNA-formamidopyrimidine glycosylase/DNA-(apurinic or apyrimidinic site) lyase [Anaerolineales bacterium]|nr:MAG: bifunctional DNA-formamidopyrimidine glycosylase/DNA-(apurinic or apyrimidinic site) lyase [Anaerolineales bacterium]